MSLILRWTLVLVSLIFPSWCLDVVMDCDPGTDDAMALLMLTSKLSNVNLIAVTTVTGNTGVVNTSRNALLILQVANRTDIPVYAGSSQGLVFNKSIEFYFGEDGLGDTFKNKGTLTTTKHSAEVLAEIVKERPGEITVLATGPLTNIALAIHLNPNFLEQVKELVFLGGSYTGSGTVAPGVEFNVGSDPEAAVLVFSKAPPNKPICVVPHETIDDIQMPLEWRLEDLGKIDTCQMKFLNRAENLILHKSDHYSVADQATAMTILEPSIMLSTEDFYISVENCGRFAKGAFLRDDRAETSNARIVTKIDQELLKEKMVQYLSIDSGNCIE